MTSQLKKRNSSSFEKNVDVFLLGMRPNFGPLRKVEKPPTLYILYIFQSHPGRGSSFAEKSATCGRMVCDIKISAKELVRFKSFDLTELTAQFLKQTRFDLDFDQIRNMYRWV